MASEVYQNLCGKMLVPNSDRLARIWAMIADEVDAGLLNAMPGTEAQLAEATGMTVEETGRRLRELFTKGVVYESLKPEGVRYFPPKHLVQFHDGSSNWPGAPRAFLDLWKEFMNEEYPALVTMMASAGFPAFMRVVPSLQSSAGLNLDPVDDLEDMIGHAQDLAVCKCPCRLVERNCDSPLEVCIQLGKGAKYAVKRGTGRAIDKQEALAIVRRSEEAGLVHCVDNHQKIGTFICNCCNDCCAIIKPGLIDPSCRPILASSRFRAEVSPELCIADALCEEACPVHAISLDSGDEAVVNREICIGCGLCLSACEVGAISLNVVRDVTDIPQ